MNLVIVCRVLRLHKKTHKRSRSALIISPSTNSQISRVRFSIIVIEIVDSSHSFVCYAICIGYETFGPKNVP